MLEYWDTLGWYTFPSVTGLGFLWLSVMMVSRDTGPRILRRTWKTFTQNLRLSIKLWYNTRTKGTRASIADFVHPSRIVYMRMKTPVEDRLWSRVVEAYGCWEWRGSLSSSGYGQIGDESGKLVTVHRLAYELLVGPIPTGLVLDHTCRNQRCVNPLHLDITTSAINTARGDHTNKGHNRLKTECKYGHKFTEDNTYRYGTARQCKICRDNRVRRYRSEYY